MKLRTSLSLIALLIVGIILTSQSNQAKGFEKQKQADIVNRLTETDYFEEAVLIIKAHEGWHTKKHYPYVGYGHKVLKSETLDYTISEEFATELVRKDLRQKCQLFTEYGKDSLLLGVLAYNTGEYKLINQDGSPKATLLKKLKSGDRDIYHDYISYRMAWGRIIPSLEKRRIKEFNTLYNKMHVERRIAHKD